MDDWRAVLVRADARVATGSFSSYCFLSRCSRWGRLGH